MNGILNLLTILGYYIPDTTNYDYDAPVAENGELRPKYFRFQQIMKGALKLQKMPKALPMPESKNYGELKVSRCVNLGQIMAAAGEPITADHPIPMEQLGNGYGYAVYETSTWGGGRQILKLTEKVIRDRALVFIDAKQVGLIEPKSSQLEFMSPSSEKHTLSFLVENQGRVNWAAPGDTGRLDDQKKGILGNIEINGKILEKWKMWSLSFNETHINKLVGQKDWWSTNCEEPLLPGIMKTHLTLKDPPKDTFIQLPDWGKGIVLVNGFNIGRYWSIGPQKTYYIPAPLLK